MKQKRQQRPLEELKTAQKRTTMQWRGSDKGTERTSRQVGMRTRSTRATCSGNRVEYLRTCCSD